MRPALIEKALTSLIIARRPVMLWGPPGVGKSKLVRAVADKMFCPKEARRHGKTALRNAKATPGAADVDYFIDLRLALMDPTGADFRFPIVDNKAGTVRWVTSEDFPRDGRGIIFLDELPQASPIIQSAASSLILDYRIGSYILPPGWSVVAAGNRSGDRSSTHKMPAHISDRFFHIDYDVHFPDWKDWAIGNGIEQSVIAFLGFRPELLHKFDPAERSSPTPRSWEFVSDILRQGIDDECFLEMIEGKVGKGAAHEFVGFFRVFRELPDYEDIVKRPDQALVPDNSGALYAVTTMLAMTAEARDATPVFKYMERLPKDFQVLLYRDVGKKNPDVAETQGYIRWTTANQAILLNR